jgi:hypothetical protein
MAKISHQLEVSYAHDPKELDNDQNNMRGPKQLHSVGTSMTDVLAPRKWSSDEFSVNRLNQQLSNHEFWSWVHLLSGAISVVINH